VSGEALAAGDVVAFDDAAGSERVFKADASSGVGELTNAVGLNVSAVGGSGVAVQVVFAGEVAVADAQFDATPATSDVGKRVYMSENAGKLTLTAPSTAGTTKLRIGTVTRGGTGNVKILVDLGQEVVN
jgi:hypothetical protein